MSEQDEARLRRRIHTIGDVIESRYADGPSDLFNPRRSHRVTVTVAVAAAAAIVLIVVALVVTRGTRSTTTRVAGGSGELNGLKLGPVGTFALVDTPNGIVAVVADHDGRPAVYAPDANGRYAWIAQEESMVASDPKVTVTELHAWRDGDSIRVLERQRRDCPEDDDPGSPGGLDDFMAGRCSPESLLLTKFRLGSRAPWGGGGTVTGNASWKVLAVGGKRVLGLSSMGGAGSQLILMGTSGLLGLPSDLVASDHACGSAGTFVFAEPAARQLRFTLLDLWKRSDGTPYRPPVRVNVPLRGDATIDDPGNEVSVVGCVADGMVVSVTDHDGSGEASRHLRVLSVSDGETAIEFTGLLDSTVEGHAGTYEVDETRSTLVDRRPDGRTAVLVGGRWRVLTAPVPKDARVALSATGQVFVLEPDSGGFTMKRTR